MIRITSKGFKGKGVYVGRPSVFGNPYPTKKSKYSNKVYSLRESLELYEKYFISNILPTKEFEELIKMYRKEEYLELDCWCVDREIRRFEDVDISRCKCHAEIIASAILFFCEPPED